MLRTVEESDLPTFFEHQRDIEAARRASAMPRDQEAYVAHWRGKVLGDPSREVRTVIVDGAITGYVGSFERDGRRMISYWLGREFWGRGIATAAVMQFLATVDLRRPIHADVARANLPSRRVLEKCGFHVVDQPPGSDDVSVLLYELTAP